MRRRRAGAAVLASLALGCSTALATPARVPEPGFVIHPYAETGGTPSSLSFGRDTREGADGQRLYVADYAGSRVLAFDAGAAGGPPEVFANDVNAPLGVLGAPDGSVYVTGSEGPREGPFGFRVYGIVWRLQDRDGDGVAEKRNVVLRDLPNGRHNTNGMALGPDGLLYVANGNSTDDGVEGGESEVLPWSGSVVRVHPLARNLSLTALDRSHYVATGGRNLYDVAFSPVDGTKLFVPMNGVDDARRGSTAENPLDPNLEDSDDVLFMTDVTGGPDDFGFPRCLFNETERGDLEPYQNPNRDVIERFGPCRPERVTPPISSFGLHTSADGLAFQTTKAWGPDYRNDLFVAEWGQLFGPPRGHDVIRVEFDSRGTKVIGQERFLELPLPIDVAFDRTGAMYVADFTGTIFKVDRVP